MMQPGMVGAPAMSPQETLPGLDDMDLSIECNQDFLRCSTGKLLHSQSMAPNTKVLYIYFFTSVYMYISINYTNIYIYIYIYIYVCVHCYIQTFVIIIIFLLTLHLYICMYAI